MKKSRIELIKILTEDFKMKSLSRKSISELEKIYNNCLLELNDNNNLHEEVCNEVCNKVDQEFQEIHIELEIQEQIVLDEEIEKVDNKDNIPYEMSKEIVVKMYNLETKNTTERIVILYQNDYEIGDIRRILDIKYQHVYNTLKRKNLLNNKEMV